MEKAASNLKISFILRKGKAVNGKYPLYARIKGVGATTELSLKRYIHPNLWDFGKGQVNPRARGAGELLDFLEEVQYDIRSAFRDLYREGTKITGKAIKAHYLGLGKEQPTGLLEMFDYHYKRASLKLKPGTLKNYNATKQYVANYIKHKFRSKDYWLINLNFAFIDGFELFLRFDAEHLSKQGLHNNGIMKHMERLQKVVKLAVMLEEIPKDPFSQYKRSMEKVKHTYLTMPEIELLHDYKSERETFELVRDLFLFSCYTGLAYVDLENLTYDNVMLGIDGQNWLVGTRQKSGKDYKIPLLPPANQLLKVYMGHARKVNEKVCFPTITGQKVNAYLKLIAKEVGIEKKITFYVARHTFATTVTLSNGVPIESVSKMLGHTKITTTQIYAKVLDPKLGQDMATLNQRLFGGQWPNNRAESS